MPKFVWVVIQYWEGEVEIKFHLFIYLFWDTTNKMKTIKKNKKNRFSNGEETQRFKGLPSSFAFRRLVNHTNDGLSDQEKYQFCQNRQMKEIMQHLPLFFIFKSIVINVLFLSANTFSREKLNIQQFEILYMPKDQGIWFLLHGSF